MGCIARKKVGRDSTDAKVVTTTYEGLHNHHSRNSGSDTLAQNTAPSLAIKSAPPISRLRKCSDELKLG